MRRMRGFAHESEEVFAVGLDEMKVAIRVLPTKVRPCSFVTIGCSYLGPRRKATVVKNAKEGEPYSSFVVTSISVFGTASAHLAENRSRCRSTAPLVHDRRKVLIER